MTNKITIDETLNPDDIWVNLDYLQMCHYLPGEKVVESNGKGQPKSLELCEQKGELTITEIRLTRDDRGRTGTGLDFKIVYAFAEIEGFHDADNFCHKDSKYEVASKAWYDDIFTTRVPPVLKSIVQHVCDLIKVTGYSDPMHIANIIALETGLGDGCGNFNDNKLAYRSSANRAMAAAHKIMSIYENHLLINGIDVDAKWIFLEMVQGHLRTLDKNIIKILGGETAVVGDDWLDKNELPEGAVTIPNPNRVGTKDCYLAGRVSNPIIAAYRREKLGLDDITLILMGETVVVDDDWLDKNELPEGAVTIPNRNRIGAKYRYLAGLTSNPTIAAYRREKLGLDDAPEDAVSCGMQ